MQKCKVAFKERILFENKLLPVHFRCKQSIIITGSRLSMFKWFIILFFEQLKIFAQLRIESINDFSNIDFSIRV